MSQIRKELIEAARAAGDHDYADWVASLVSMPRRDVLVRLAYYRVGGV
jgi:hypothetical protein